MPYIMPVMLMFMFNNFPAALTYYYLLQNLLGVGHQWLIQKFFIDESKLRKQIEENKKNPKQPSGWQKRLADMQKQAEQLLAEAKRLTEEAKQLTPAKNAKTTRAKKATSTKKQAA